MKIRIVRKHGTTKQAAKSAIETKLPSVIRGFGTTLSQHEYAWDGDVMSFSFQARVLTFGVSAKGTLGVTDTDLVLDMDVDGIPRLLQGRARRQAESAMEKWGDEVF